MLKKTAARSSSHKEIRSPKTTVKVTHTKTVVRTPSSKKGVTASPFSSRFATPPVSKKVAAPSSSSRKSSSISLSRKNISSSRTQTVNTVGFALPQAKRTSVRSPASKSVMAKRTAGYRIKRAAKLTLRELLLSKMFGASVRVLVVGFLTVSAVYGVYQKVNTTFAGNVVISKAEIARKVSLLTGLPADGYVDVVRVQDPENLRKQNIFYSHVVEGDYIVVYPDSAAIYDLKNNKILAIKRPGQ